MFCEASTTARNHSNIFRNHSFFLFAAKIGYKSVPMYQTNFYGGSTVVKSVLYTKFGEARWHEGNQRDKQESTWACLSIRGLNWSEELF